MMSALSRTRAPRLPSCCHDSKIVDRDDIPLDEIIEHCANLETERGGFVGVIESIARHVFQHVGAVQLTMVPLMVGFKV